VGAARVSLAALLPCALSFSSSSLPVGMTPWLRACARPLSSSRWLACVHVWQACKQEKWVPALQDSSLGSLP
jgi:hypothetical protein